MAKRNIYAGKDSNVIKEAEGGHHPDLGPDYAKRLRHKPTRDEMSDENEPAVSPDIVHNPANHRAAARHARGGLAGVGSDQSPMSSAADVIPAEEHKPDTGLARHGYKASQDELNPRGPRHLGHVHKREQ
jgi:hypothetical protein